MAKGNESKQKVHESCFFSARFATTIIDLRRFVLELFMFKINKTQNIFL